MKRFIKYYAFTVLMLVSGCNKFVEIAPPNTQLVTSTVFESDATAYSALATIYASMVTQTASPFIISQYTGLMGDELKTSANGATLQNLYKNNLQALEAPTNDIWIGAYNIIYQANAVIEGCSKSAKMSDDAKIQIQAEATFLRAFWHFYLVNLYGDIPYVRFTDYNLNKNMKKQSQAEVMKLIIDDLIFSGNNISKEYIDGDKMNPTDTRIRANRSVVRALLARAYCYSGKWAEAEIESTSIIADKANYDLEPLEEVFKINSSEAIFQLMTPQPSFINTTEGSGYILFTRPGSGANGKSTLSASLLKAFEDGDLRKDSWVGKIETEDTTYCYPFKYKIPFGAPPVSEHSVVLRLAEQYLIRAEARVYQNKLIDAIADIDAVRTRAGLPSIKEMNAQIGKEELLAAILQERRIELFTEWGHRWMDLRRTNTINAIMTEEAKVKKSIWSDYKQIFPIPQKDLENNRNLAQNEGYLK